MLEEISSIWLAQKFCETTNNSWKRIPRSPSSNKFELRKTLTPFWTFWRVLPIIASCWPSQNVHIVGKYMNFRSEKWLCFRTMPVLYRQLDQRNVGGNDWRTLEQHPFSPELFSCNKHMFGPLKEASGREWFDDNTIVEAFVRNLLETRLCSFYDDGIKKKLWTHWEKCVLKSGDKKNNM